MSSNPNTQSNSAKSHITPQKAPLPNAESTLLSNSFLHRTIHDAGHDLRSPLFVIRGYAQLLQRTQDKERLKRGMELMEEASFKMEKTINGFVELMDIYSLPNAEKKITLLESIVDSSSIALSIIEENIDDIIILNIEPNQKLFFNENYLKVIVLSLLENAVRHNLGQENLMIEIRCRRTKNGSIILEVDDNGKGIDLSVEQETLKKPFYKHGGPENIGIGLAKVEAIAQVTKNSFAIKSIPGIGTKCTFTFRGQLGVNDLN